MSKLNSSYMKEVLIKENRDDTGFHERPGKKSEFVYDTKGGRNYVEQLTLNLAL